MNLNLKESASLFQSAGMSSLVRCMFQINELFLCCLAVQCLVLNFVSVDYCKWLHRKNCSKNCFQYLSAKSSLVWLWTHPITRHEAACIKVFWRSTIEAFSFLAELHVRFGCAGGAPYGDRTPPARPSAPQGHQCSISHFLASLGAQENWYCTHIAHQCCDQLTAVKTGYLLTSITWPYRGLRMYKMKFSYYQEYSVIHGLFVYWVFGWVKVGNAISDGIVFIFHRAWCVRGLKSLKGYWLYLIPFRSCISNGKPE